MRDDESFFFLSFFLLEGIRQEKKKLMFFIVVVVLVAAAVVSWLRAILSPAYEKRQGDTIIVSSFLFENRLSADVGRLNDLR